MINISKHQTSVSLIVKQELESKFTIQHQATTMNPPHHHAGFATLPGIQDFFVIFLSKAKL